MKKLFGRWTVLAALLVFAVFAVPSCSEPVGGGTDSNTHWLATCAKDADCGGLNCLCGACTKACAGDSTCEGLGSGASCMTPNCSTVSGNTCGIPCANDGDCTRRNAGLYCRAGQCAAVPSLDAGSSAGQCPTTHVDGAPCNGPDGVCWTSCVQGFKSEFVCSGGHWLAGHGLFPCGDGGVASQPDGGVVIDAGRSNCDPVEPSQIDLCNSLTGWTVWDGSHCTPVCGCHGVNCYAPNEASQCVSDHEHCVGIQYACVSNADCVAAGFTCCPCDGPLDYGGEAISRQSAAAWASLVVCPPGQTCKSSCGNSPTLLTVPICQDGECMMTGMSSLNACTKDADCFLQPNNCCACAASLQDPGAFSAVSSSQYFDQVCTMDCAPRAPCAAGDPVAFPTWAHARCAGGVCAVQQDPH